MTNQHPITPPPELVKQWGLRAFVPAWHKSSTVLVPANDIHIATQAARWGADQELDACCEWLTDQSLHPDGSYLRADRRPKSPRVQVEQALEALERIDGYAIQQMSAYAIHDELKDDADTIRRALERLQKLEEQLND
jgi:hypothetical protein